MKFSWESVTPVGGWGGGGGAGNGSPDDGADGDLKSSVRARLISTNCCFLDSIRGGIFPHHAENTAPVVNMVNTVKNLSTL